MFRLSPKYIIFTAIFIYPLIVFAIIQSLISIDDIILFMRSLDSYQITCITVASLVGLLIFLYHIYDDFSTYQRNGNLNSFTFMTTVLLDAIQDFAMPLFLISGGCYYYVIHINEPTAIESLLEKQMYIEARSIAQRECSQRFGESCYKASELLRSGIGGKRDLKEANRLLKMACQYEDTEACARLGDHYRRLGQCINRDSTPIKKKCALSLKSYEFACKNENLNSCFWVAYYTSAGTVRRADLSTALKLYVESCKKGHGKSCHYSSRYYKSGWGVAKDEELHQFYKKRSCELNYVQDCHHHH